MNHFLHPNPPKKKNKKSSFFQVFQEISIFFFQKKNLACKTKKKKKLHHKKHFILSMPALPSGKDRVGKGVLTLWISSKKNQNLTRVGRKKLILPPVILKKKSKTTLRALLLRRKTKFSKGEQSFSREFQPDLTWSRCKPCVLHFFHFLPWVP